jgi:hypothetical protein
MFVDLGGETAGGSEARDPPTGFGGGLFDLSKREHVLARVRIHIRDLHESVAMKGKLSDLEWNDRRAKPHSASKIANKADEAMAFGQIQSAQHLCAIVEAIALER